MVDDNEDLLRAARLFLKRHFAQVHTETSPHALPGLLASEHYDVVLLDMNFTKDVSSGSEGFYWLDRILQQDPNAVVVLITAYGDVEMAVQAIKAGATDFVVKPWENQKLLATLLSAMRLGQHRQELQNLRVRHEQLSQDQAQPFKEIIGQSAAMQQVYTTIERVAQTDANVLILGENGTGKELIARAIHRQSLRHQGPFVPVDLGSISETLFESELFGHMKGAFTDARAERPGRFETAQGGTLFLDEIGNLSLPLQAKLLTVLQSRQVTRVGANKSRPIDVRLVCATNLPIYQEVESQQFRQDLLYRINTIEINLPPLRERADDVPLLAQHFMQQYSRKYHKNVHSISPAALTRMQHYHWPGNVRELQHALERAVIMSTQNTLQPEDFYFNTRPEGPAAAASSQSAELNLEQYNLEDVERILIRKVLKKHNGNVTQAAQELGLTRSSLYRRLEKYGI